MIIRFSIFATLALAACFAVPTLTLFAEDWPMLGRDGTRNPKSLGVTAPVVAGGRLYLRDSTRLFCYDISVDAFAKPRPEALQAAIGLRARELEEKFSRADVVTAFLYPRLMERLIPQFQRLKPGSRIVSHQFELPGVKPDRDIAVDSGETGQTHRALLWTTPLKKQ